VVAVERIDEGVGDQLRIGFEKASLAQVIGFLCKLALSLDCRQNNAN